MLCLQPQSHAFSFPLFFHNDKKDEKKVVGNAHSHITLPLNIAFCQGKHNKNWTIFNLIKLLFDINVVKIFLKSSFYYYVENHCKRFRHALTDHHFNPSPLVANFPLIGKKLNCRLPLKWIHFIASTVFSRMLFESWKKRYQKKFKWKCPRKGKKFKEGPRKGCF